ncbi:hypothetical protein BKK79_19880 [Cupriavidus sp. USMAA2-4]|uniref:hypothetical protein n=1 Tax=Cupriavidus sp. USMAA2-4 TaxID=876364 RepID=UPI0008A6EF5F|nr:hypothetical protein [Cupriavidus sp. USMAA2-4]AOY93807.1 hypothetical protein BKK79_19880 [Cupriavidus sp. USMAA2-4]
MRKQAKQSWEVGQQVKVGFLAGLTVVAKIPTPGDYAPAAYVLVRGEQFYSFVPHNGLTKITAAEAREMVADAKRVHAAAEARAAAQAAGAIAAAKLAAELMAA